MSEQKDSSLQQNDERIYRINKEIFDQLPEQQKEYYLKANEMPYNNRGEYYITMEDLEGLCFVSIKELFKADSKIEIKSAKLNNILKKLKEIRIEILKDKTIIHGGLGFDNIIVNPDNGDVKLTDLNSLMVVKDKNNLTKEEQQELRISMRKLNIVIGCMNELISPQYDAQQRK